MTLWLQRNCIKIQLKYQDFTLDIHGFSQTIHLKYFHSEPGQNQPAKGCQSEEGHEF